MSKLSKEQFDRLIEAFNDAGFPATSYSGRGMYGKRCVGVEFERGQSEIAIAVALSRVLLLDNDADGDHALLDLIARGACGDQMGLGAIVYWPHIEWQGEDPDEEEDT